MSSPVCISFDDLLGIIKIKFLFPTLLLLILSRMLYSKKPNHRVFLLDFACYKPPPCLKCPKEKAAQLVKILGNISEDLLDLTRKVLERSGIGESTYISEALSRDRPNPCMEESRKEMEMVMFGAVDELLAKTGVQCADIGILVVNCSLFNVAPSLCSMIVKHYKLRHDIASYNLTGMGCSAGLVAVSLAQQLLELVLLFLPNQKRPIIKLKSSHFPHPYEAKQVHHNTYAMVVSTESITGNVYVGKDHSKLLVNGLFRVGGAAIILSNRPSDLRSSKYQLKHVVNTHMASSDKSYSCIFQEEDDEGHVGVSINKDLLVSAVTAIRSNLKALAPLVLPVPEQLKVLKNTILRFLQVAGIKPYVPDFGMAVDHFLPHVGGKPVLDALQGNLGFNDEQMEASRMTLYRYGNISSSSIWYELAYVEAKGRVRRGDRVWQIAFGAGFNCNSVVWRAIRTVRREETKVPWTDEIDEFPVDLNDIKPIDSTTQYFESSKQDLK